MWPLLLALLATLPIACRGEPERATGYDLYMRLCAACHGERADGRGPVAAALRVAPPDLRTLARRNGGRFDGAAVAAAIGGGREVAAHGARNMPVWGVIFAAEPPEAAGPDGGGEGWQVRALTDYLRSIQLE